MSRPTGRGVSGALRAIVGTWPFVLSLLILIVNDTWLKSAYPGLLTGKLSDFAGIAVVGLLLLASFPDHRRWVSAAIAGGFAWWKSSLSQPAIDRQDYQIRRPDGGAELDRAAVAETIAQVSAQHGLKCEDCADRTNRGRYRGGGIGLEYVFIGPRSVAFQVEAFPNFWFFGASGKGKADRLRDDLKSRLASSHKDLEYIEQIAPGPSGTR